MAALANKLGTLVLAKDPARALRYFQHAVAADPGYTFAWYNCGSAHSELGDTAAALECFETAARLDGAFAEAAANAGGCCLKLGRYEEAIEHCTRALALKPGYRDARFNLNNALRFVGRQQEAVEGVWAALAPLLPSPWTAPLLHPVPSPAGAPVAPSPSSAPSSTAALPSPSPSTAAAPAPLPTTTFVCVKWGVKYGPEYVNKLRRGVWRSLPAHALPHCRFVCVTDDATGLDEGVSVVPLPPSALRGWWAKLWLFDPALTAEWHPSRIVYIDLDTVICGSLAWTLTHTGGFAILGTGGMANEARVGGLNSSLMLWDTCTTCCDAAVPCASIHAVFALFQAVGGAAVQAHVHRLDHWLEIVTSKCFDAAPIILQDAYPGEVIEYAAACVGVDALPPGASVVVFPLSPKPHEVVAGPSSIAPALRALWE